MVVGKNDLSSRWIDIMHKMQVHNQTFAYTHEFLLIGTELLMNKLFDNTQLQRNRAALAITGIDIRVVAIGSHINEALRRNANQLIDIRNRQKIGHTCKLNP